MIPLHILPEDGTVLLTGAPSQQQSAIAFDLALTAALAGGRVVVLVDTQAQVSNLADKVIAWRAARDIPNGHRLRVTGVPVHGVARFDLLDRVSAALNGQGPDLVVRDLALRPSAIDPADEWWKASALLAKAYRCVVLTAAHCGARGVVDDLSNADLVWWASTFRHAERNDNVKLMRVKPTDGHTVSLTTSARHGLTVFDEIQEPIQ